MKKKFFNLTVVVLFFVSIFFVTFSEAKEKMPPPPPPQEAEQVKGEPFHDFNPQFGFFRFALNDPQARERLKLTKEQNSQIDELLNVRDKFNVTKRAEVSVAFIDLKKEMKNEKIDLKRIEELGNIIANGTSEIQKNNIKTLAQILSILTLEQREELEKIQQVQQREMMQHFRKGWKR